MAQAVRGFLGAGLMVGAAALPASAQGLALPAADPVGIARSGVQVAYGYSLEAAAMNPALLASLKEKGGFYLASGLEMQSAQTSLESNQRGYFTDDRNRVLAAFGYARRLRPDFTLGLKVDAPFMRHGQLPVDAPSRFLGDGIDLSARRLEVQGAWALNPNLSLGLGLGVARLGFESTSVMRFGVALDPTQPISGTNTVQGLVEQQVGQQGSKVVPSYSLGLRWALSPRWTLGFAHQSGLKGDLGLEASFKGAPRGYYNSDGYLPAPPNPQPGAAALLAASTPLDHTATLQLPSLTTVGMRHRIHPLVTWEADVRWTSAGLRLPAQAGVQTPSGAVAAPSLHAEEKGHLGFGASVEVELGKAWMLRAGLFMDQRSREEQGTDPLVGGAPTSAFSAGMGYKVWGGELSLGYQYRQNQDQDSRSLTGNWSASGYRTILIDRLRVEGMGHLFALGFKKMF